MTSKLILAIVAQLLKFLGTFSKEQLDQTIKWVVEAEKQFVGTNTGALKGAFVKQKMKEAFKFALPHVTELVLSLAISYAGSAGLIKLGESA